MDNQIELKPCPFCGGKAVLYGQEIRDCVNGERAKLRKEYWVKTHCDITCIYAMTAGTSLTLACIRKSKHTKTSRFTFFAASGADISKLNGNGRKTPLIFRRCNRMTHIILWAVGIVGALLATVIILVCMIVGDDRRG